MVIRFLRSLFKSSRRPVKAPTCRLPGCSRPCFVEPTGRRHDFCGISHARAWSGEQARSAAVARFDGRQEYTTPEMVLFWQPPSVFSQWTPSAFVVDDVRYTCAEQYMMSEKAKLFGDDTVWRKIMSTDDPREHKDLGRRVGGYEQRRWDEQKRRIVTRGSYEKFTQNPYMGQRLLDTGEKILAEASPLDSVWGIGLRADNPDARSKATWRGQNLLGEILQEVRARILMEAVEASG